MKNDSHIYLSAEKGVDTIWLNRPEMHNAFDPEMIRELTARIKQSEDDDGTRLIVIRGKGPSFSSGADLGYMQKMAGFSKEENMHDAEILANLFYSIYHCKKPVITVAHGNVAGGANGILAASDYALCTHRTLFRFSELKLGLIPATIAPYILSRIGEFRAMELMLTGKPFSGLDAAEYGLVNKAVSDKELDSMINETLKFFLSSAPGAITATKKLIRKICFQGINPETRKMTATALAEIRSSNEAREGLDAFFMKRKPEWNQS